MQNETPPDVILAERKAKYEADKKQRETALKGKEAVIKGVDIPFWDLVVLLVKVSFAAIPAGFICVAAWFFIFALLKGFL